MIACTFSVPETLLRLLDCIDDPAMRTPGKDHQAFSFYVKKEQPAHPEKCRFDLFAALYLMSRGHFLIAGDPLYVSGECTRRE